MVVVKLFALLALIIASYVIAPRWAPKIEGTQLFKWLYISEF